VNLDSGSALSSWWAREHHTTPCWAASSTYQDEVPPLTKDLARATSEAKRLSQRYRECAPILGELRTQLQLSAESPSTTLEDALADYASRPFDPNVPSMTIETTISPSTAPLTPAMLLETLAAAREYTPRADATERAYAHDLSAFKSWCEASGRQAMPATPDDLAD
jgi:hypothetical protein